MKLTRMRLHNFRQFYGTSPIIQFSDGKKNITVFHGTNGAGKTALLNAFTWLLHDTTTSGFLLPDQIVNIRAIREKKVGESVSAYVELEFNHDSFKYKLRRTHNVIRTEGRNEWESKGQSTPELHYSGPNGQWQPDLKVADAIGHVLPKDLHSYFFFDGERIEKIVQPSAKEQKEIGNATRMLLGVEVFDRAVKHLKGAVTSLKKELRDIGDSETRRLIDDENKKKETIKNKKNRQKEIRNNIKAEEKREKEIDSRLSELADTKVIQERREQLIHLLATRQNEYNDNKKLLAKAISTEGYKLFLSKPVKKFQTLIRNLHDRGELPSGIKRNFVESLLKANTCICTQSLKHGSKYRTSVEEWMRKAGLVDVEEKALIMDGEVKQINFTVNKTLEDFDVKHNQLLSNRTEISTLENELEEIHKKLEESPKEKIRRLEKTRQKIRYAVRDFDQELGGVAREINDLETKISKLINAIEKHKMLDGKQETLQKQIKAALDAKDRIHAVCKLLEDEFRDKLLNKIKVLFSEISPTPYIPTLSDDYSLHLLNSSGGTPVPVAASEGESQILSLSFIGSIIDVTREIYSAHKDSLFPTSSCTYPLVMDSPFGKLGPTYRRQIAIHLPKLADQVVLMVTDTQWRDEVAQAMSEKVGRSYVLTYFTPRSDIDNESIDINGESFQLVKSSPNDYEYTEIKEIKYG